MRVVIAAWHLKNFNVGLGRYCRALIEAIGRVDADNQYEILLPDASYRFPPRPNLRYRLIRFPFFKRRFWEQVAPCLVGRYDVLHFPYDSCIAWKRGKFMATVHDLKPLIFDMDKGRSSWNVNHVIENILVRDRWARIDHVLTDSLSSRRDIMERLPVPAERVTVVYPGVDQERFRPAPVPASRMAGERGRPYVLCVAGADPTKNVETLVQAFGRLPRPLQETYDLVLAGDFRRRSELHELVGEVGIARQTVFPGVVSDEQLIELYRGATVLVFPSRYEGFGFPVLEAMACGCPVISSNASSLPEVAGEAALLVEPWDILGFASLLERVLMDPALQADLRKKGLVRAAEFSWDRTARETIAVYQRVAGRAVHAV